MLEPLSPGQLRWRCRRGVKELDVLLTRFLEHGYAHLSVEQQGQFQALLTLEDPELASYCLAQQPPPEALRPLIERLSQFRGELSSPTSVSASRGQNV